MKKLKWNYFYTIGWFLGIASMVLPFGAVSWMDSGPNDLPGFSYLLFMLMFTFLSPMLLVYVVMFISFFFPRISSRSKLLKIFTVMISGVLWFNPGLVNDASIGYYLWVTSLTFFTVAVWTYKNKMTGSTIRPTEPRVHGPVA
jgi:hypothetical protein